MEGLYHDDVSCINLFTLEFMNWNFPSLSLDTSIVVNRGIEGFSLKSITELQTVSSLMRWMKNQQTTYSKYLSFFFSRKQNLTVHADCLQ